MFTVLALFTQFLFLFSEIIQMRVKGTSVKDYFGEVWNWNDILCLPVYFALQISIWVAVSKANKTAGAGDEIFTI